MGCGSKAGINYGAGLARNLIGPLSPIRPARACRDKLRAQSSAPRVGARLDVQTPETVPGFVGQRPFSFPRQSASGLPLTLNQEPSKARA